MQKINYNNKIYELKFDYIYFSVINNYSDAGHLNFNENNVLNVNISVDDSNIDQEEINYVFNQGLNTINKNILNKIYQKHYRFNNKYLGNFNEITTIVNQHESEELYILVKNIAN